ncbi:PhoX family phosphatase [Nocardiopsis sp. MG754419]|uniref:PhoX family protein n=1 Tax=Nocardiopsis sp. MG754419 TaxID=2259865 RepID=UPI001BA94996|nr:alkaline phosphatase PhoX [Nocardiopsis sp. MG754419]MBR8743202.1 hypothetical protein [Nocardiopsis sp. MG754419]
MPPEHSRRRFLQATAAMGTLTTAALLGGSHPGAHPALASTAQGSTLIFTEVPVTDGDAITVPAGYTARVLLPWGTPLRTGGPRWRPDATGTAEDAARQVGFGHSGLRYVPLHPGHAGNRRGLLVIGHARVDPALLHADGGRAGDAAQTAKETASLGVTVARVEHIDGRWRVVGDELNRRLTGDSPTTVSGPLADHPALETGTDPVGVLGGSGQALTPWGTCLTGEDTFADVFGTASADWTADAAQTRYGLSADAVLGWHHHRERFDLERNPNEAHRFGWTVEVDPLDPGSTPFKRTALGRIAHGGATVTESRGRAVVYMCDRTHVYKFVGAHPWRERLRDRGAGPLEEGTLYAARLEEDGSGTWARLVHGASGLTTDDGFADQADVLLRAREAADAVGATELRGPGAPAVHPHTGTVYCPETETPGGGRVLSWTEGASDHGAALFSWRASVEAPTPSGEESARSLAAPEGVRCGDDGRLWITSDVGRIDDADLRARVGNSALFCVDPADGEVRRFLTGPRGCGIAGTTATPDGRTLFVTVRGPGSATADHGAPTAEDPRAVGNWPGFDPEGRPRSAVVVVRRDDGGVIGT